jgi:YjbE family integral membrane protein
MTAALLKATPLWGTASLTARILDWQAPAALLYVIRPFFLHGHRESSFFRTYAVRIISAYISESAMEILSPEFFPALAAIVIIDLVLAGDNAIVIALAARNLPNHLRTKAIVWGTVGAIVVRTLLTLCVVWLLRIPGLMLAGGLMLVWIAYRLMTEQEAGGHEVSPATSFWSAMRTIVVADAVMGLDNVIAVAGAASGSWLLVISGLVISVPIMIWGSTLILKWIERFPAIIYIGGAVLAWTAAKMVIGEPFVEEWMAGPRQTWPIYAIFILGTLGLAWFAKRRRPSAPQHS